MAESLNVIALISGGKDSFFSILHCLQNGHKVVALGNLHPESPNSKSAKKRASQSEEANEDDEHDLNSFMYQTVGHSVIPLYEKALGIPLYRQPIIGTAVQTGASYSHFDAAKAGTYLSDQRPESGINSEIHDETESLVPLLRRIMEEHPCANALSTGAILSTYQRTRVESVALRLGLTPLSYLWKYPILPPGTQASLLQDMQAVGLDARIVKVASGGLDEGFLWENVASQAVTRRIEISMKRFATDGDGAVLGEGGEFETLVLDGPGHLFKGIITVQDKDRRIIREGGGSEWLQIKDAMITMKSQDQAAQIDCRVPEFLEDRFQNLLALLSGDNIIQDLPFSQVSFPSSISSSMISTAIPFDNAIIHDETVYWTVSSTQSKQSISISEDAQQIITEIKQRLSGLSLQTSNIISSLVILRSMQDFITINQIYGSLFKQPNPPARVTVACGSIMPPETNLIIHLKIQNHPSQPPPRRALHVQSRSYWAPANIGPYSQAISIPQSPSTETQPPINTVSVAGQIALVPASMALPTNIEIENPSQDNFSLQTVLALQHLWRIAREMDISWWTSAVAYLPHNLPSEVQKQAKMAGRAWILAHARKSLDEDEDEDEEEVRDLWEEKHYAGKERRGGEKAEWRLPDWDLVKGEIGELPPFWAAEVEELPRGALVEWHAHVGIMGGGVTVGSVAPEASWSAHQCIAGNRTYLVVMIVRLEDRSRLREKLGEIFENLGGELGLLPHIYLSYLDSSTNGVVEAGEFTGIVPCKTIWDATGRQLSAVLLLDLPSG